MLIAIEGDNKEVARAAECDLHCTMTMLPSTCVRVLLQSVHAR